MFHTGIREKEKKIVFIPGKRTDNNQRIIQNFNILKIRLFGRNNGINFIETVCPDWRLRGTVSKNYSDQMPTMGFNPEKRQKSQ